MTEPITTPVAGENKGTPIPDDMFKDGRIPEKFRGKTLEDVATSYHDAEKAKTQAEMARAATEKALTEERANQARTQRYGQPEISEEDKLAEKYGLDPSFVKDMSALNQQRSRAALDPVLGQVAITLGSTRIETARRDPEMPKFREYEKEIQALLDQSPEIYANPDALRIGYKFVEGLKIDEVKDKARKYDELMNKGKENAHVLGGGSSNTPVTTDLKGKSAADIKSAFIGVIPTVD